MKEKDILKHLKKEADQQLPNLSAFMQDRFPQPQPQRRWQWLPVATLLATVMIVAIVISGVDPIMTPSSSLTSTSLPTSSTPVSSEPTSSENLLPPLRLNADNKAVSLTTVTSVTLLSNLSLVNTMPAMQPLSVMQPFASANQEKIDFEETMILLKPYLPVFEQFLSTTQTPIITSSVSTDPLYQYRDTFTVYDIEGEPIAYALAYNIDMLETVEEETFFQLTGTLTINDETTYAVTGMKQREDDETKMVFKAILDEINFIETEYRMEDDETKIKVKKMVEGVMTITAFKVEIEDDEMSIELFFFEGNNMEQIRHRFKFKYEMEDDETIVEIKFEMQGNMGRIKGKIRVYVIPLVDEANQVIGYKYQAVQFNEDGEREDGEWEDDRHHPRRDHHS